MESDISQLKTIYTQSHTRKECAALQNYLYVITVDGMTRSLIRLPDAAIDIGFKVQGGCTEEWHQKTKVLLLNHHWTSELFSARVIRKQHHFSCK